MDTLCNSLGYYYLYVANKQKQEKNLKVCMEYLTHSQVSWWKDKMCCSLHLSVVKMLRLISVK